MAKAVARRNVGREILEGLRELKRGEVGRVVSIPPVAAVRERTGLSQVKFASLLGVSVRTLQEWEQGRRAPSGADLAHGRGQEPSGASRGCVTRAG